MSIDQARARHSTSTIFTDTCTIVNVDDYTGVLNTTTGQRAPDTTTAIYSGACSVRATSSPQFIQMRTVGGQEVAIVMYRLTLPWSGTENVRPGQTVTITASWDSSLVGRTFYVTQVVEGSWEPSRRCVLDDRIDAARQR